MPRKPMTHREGGDERAADAHVAGVPEEEVRGRARGERDDGRDPGEPPQMACERDRFLARAESAG